MEPLLLLFDVLLLTRIVYLRSDGALGLRANLLLLGLQLIALLVLFAISRTTLWTAGVLVLVALVNIGLERSRLDLAQGWRLLALIVGCSIVHHATGGLRLSWLTRTLGDAVAQYVPLLAPPGVSPAFDLTLVLFGLLLLANESNILVRAVFHWLHLEPTVNAPPLEDPRVVKIDEREYQAGRAIGILERWLIYLVVVSGAELTAIGLIIGVKGIVRFNRLERDRNDHFAEYLLVGTLLSTLLSIVVGYWTRAAGAG